MGPAQAWSTQLLAEFLVLASSFESEASAALGAVERTAEALDAEVAAIVSDRTVIAAIGFPEGSVPLDELVAVASGASKRLQVPGSGSCKAMVVRLAYPPASALVLARSGPDGLSREETSVLRGMARVTAGSMRVLHLLGVERAAREKSQRQAAENARLLAALTERQTLLEWLANEQAALRRVATLVARGVGEDEIFAAVAGEVGVLASSDLVQLFLYEPSGVRAVRVAVWGTAPVVLEIGERVPIGGHDVLTEVLQTGRPARIDDDATITGSLAKGADAHAVCSAIGSPIMLGGQVRGVIVATTTRPAPMPSGTEARISGFTDLVATAISNAAVRAELAASRARVVAASDETRRRIERDLHDGIQQRLVTLTLGLRGAIDSAPAKPSGLREQLSNAEQGLQDLLDEIREIARGLHPAILAEAGLGAALKSLARRSTVPVELDVRLNGRLSRSVEVAAYYVVSEALANTAKHANASVVRVTVEVRGEALRLEVCDDGSGGADPAGGSGLTGLSDRVDSLGGTITLSSPAGAGTTMVIELPIGREG